MVASRDLLTSTQARNSPLARPKEAATRFAGHLGAGDRLTVVAFDDTVETIYGPAQGGDPVVEDAIARIGSGGSTNLSGGWLLGRKLVQQGRWRG